MYDLKLHIMENPNKALELLKRLYSEVNTLYLDSKLNKEIEKVLLEEYGTLGMFTINTIIDYIKDNHHIDAKTGINDVAISLVLQYLPFPDAVERRDLSILLLQSRQDSKNVAVVFNGRACVTVTNLPEFKAALKGYTSKIPFYALKPPLKPKK